MAVKTVKWDNINMVMQHKFYQYLCGGNFYDCTLSCEEKFMPAHRIVLSAASKYFEKMFMMCAERQMVVLQDVAYEDLLAVMKFVYTGEAKVLSDNYERFLATAKILQIKGLVDIEPTPQQDEPQKLSSEAINLCYTLPNTPTGTAGAPAKTKQPRKQFDQKMISESSRKANAALSMQPDTPTGPSGAQAKTEQTRKQFGQKMISKSSSRKANAENSPLVPIDPRCSSVKPFAMKLEEASPAPKPLDDKPKERRKRDRQSLAEFGAANSEDPEDDMPRLRIKIAAPKKVDEKFLTPKGPCPFCLKVLNSKYIKRHILVCKANQGRQCQVSHTDNFIQNVASHSQTSEVEP